MYTIHLVDGPRYSNQDGMQAHFVAMLCKGVFHYDLLFSYSC